jgi:hypothetical protein
VPVSAGKPKINQNIFLKIRKSKAIEKYLFRIIVMVQKENRRIIETLNYE